MSFFKSGRSSPGPLITVNTGNHNNDSFPFSNHSDNDTLNASPNPLQSSNSLDPPLQDEWDINPELPRNMYMPCCGISLSSSSSLSSKSNDESCIYLNRIYILGSHKNNQCWVYDATYKTYEKLPYFPKKIIPKGHCSATCDNIIFSTGGSTESKHLLFFNTKLNEWHTTSNSRAKDFGIGCKCIAIKNKHLNNSIELHVLGGNRKPNKYYIYNQSLKQWREGPKLPLKLTYHGVIYVGTNYNKQYKNGRKSVKGYLRDHKSQLIVFGGCNVKKGWTSSLSPTTKMYRLYLDNDEQEEEEEENKYNNDNVSYRWKHIGDLPVAVQNFAYLCVLNNFILIFGGDLGDLKCSRNIYLYNIEKKNWKLLGIKLPDHLYGMTAIETKNGIIHLFGGHNGKSSQRLHLSIKTNKLLAKEFDEFDSSFTWKQLSRSGNQDINNDMHIIDELKRVKRKLKDIEEKYNLKQLQSQQLIHENKQIKQTNINLLDKLAQSMQEKEELLYQIQEIKKYKSKSPSKSSSKSSSKPATPRSKSKSRKHKKKYKHYKTKSDNDDDTQLFNNNNNNKSNNNNNYNFDPKYILFRNFLFGRIGLPQYLNEFQSSKFGNICKMIDLNDESLKLKVGISNELHRKLILKVINEFKLEILQFKSWICSYHEKECNLKQYIKPFAKYGIITWHLLAQHITNKKDFKNKLFVQSDVAIDCFYQHLQEFLNGQIPQPKNKNINYNNNNDNDNNNNKNINNINNNNNNKVLFDDSGYHNW